MVCRPFLVIQQNSTHHIDVRQTVAPHPEYFRDPPSTPPHPPPLGVLDLEDQTPNPPWTNPPLRLGRVGRTRPPPSAKPATPKSRSHSDPCRMISLLRRRPSKPQKDKKAQKRSQLTTTPAAVAPATTASAALTPTGLRKVAPINVNGLRVQVAEGEAVTSARVRRRTPPCLYPVRDNSSLRRRLDKWPCYGKSEFTVIMTSKLPRDLAALLANRERSRRD